MSGYDHKRCSPEGIAAGRRLVKLIQPALDKLELQGEPDERCNSCAFRVDTVPNGCMQTQADAWKAGIEGTPFLCHQDQSKTCHGWYAFRVRLKGVTMRCPWEFSPPDEP